jgi:hypothetical protein
MSLNHRRPPGRRALIAVALAVSSCAIAAAMPQFGSAPEAFTAFAVNRGDDAVLLSSDVDIHVRRWSTEAEKTRFARTLLDEGVIALREALQDAGVVGDIRTPYTFPFEVRFAWQEPLAGEGRRIILIGDGAIAPWRDAMRLRDRPDTFTVIELRLPYGDDGEGKVAIGSNIRVNRSLDLIELDDYGSAPLRLIGVRTRWTTT